MNVQETPNLDNNEIITITFRDLTFEIDIWKDIMMIPDEIVELFDCDNIETIKANLFFRRLIDGYNKKINVTV